jgi:hypothetical protein
VCGGRVHGLLVRGAVVCSVALVERSDLSGGRLLTLIAAIPIEYVVGTGEPTSGLPFGLPFSSSSPGASSPSLGSLLPLESEEEDESLDSFGGDCNPRASSSSLLALVAWDVVCVLVPARLASRLRFASGGVASGNWSFGWSRSDLPCAGCRCRSPGELPFGLVAGFALFLWRCTRHCVFAGENSLVIGSDKLMNVYERRYHGSSRLPFATVLMSLGFL